MPRFQVILLVGVALAALLAVALRWLWRQRGPAATAAKPYAGRLMGFNNEPGTRFADVKQVLQAARERVRSRLPAQP